MDYVVGLDGGGTKTKVQICDLNGSEVQSTLAGSFNYNSSEKAELRKTLESIMHVICNLPGGIDACKGICMSAAGISNYEAKEFIRFSLIELGFQCDIHIVGDHDAALYGAFAKPEGIVLISGTGSICYGRNQNGKSHRTGGYGHLVDDEGSGYAIGRDILKIAVQSCDKRIKHSVLLELVFEELNCNTVEEIIRFIYQANWNKANIAALSPLLLKSLTYGDASAIKIMNRAVDELFLLVNTTVQVLHLKEGNLALLGGILTHYEPLRDLLISKLSKNIPTLKIVSPLHDSATGAALIALKRYAMLHKSCE